MGIYQERLKGTIHLFNARGFPITIDSCVVTEGFIEKAVVKQCFIDSCKIIADDPTIATEPLPKVQNSRLENCTLKNCQLSQNYVRPIGMIDFTFKE